MSTVMYCYEIPKQHIWEFVDDLRQLYLKKGFNPKNIYNKIKEGALQFSEALELLDDIKSEVEVDIQLFDNGGMWLIRVLESGYLFVNNQEKSFPYLKQVFYDDRSDVSENELKNKEIAEWVDEKIDGKYYMIIPIVTVSGMVNELILLRLEETEKKSDGE